MEKCLCNKVKKQAALGELEPRWYEGSLEGYGSNC